MFVMMVWASYDESSTSVPKDRVSRRLPSILSGRFMKMYLIYTIQIHGLVKPSPTQSAISKVQMRKTQSMYGCSVQKNEAVYWVSIRRFGCFSIQSAPRHYNRRLLGFSALKQTGGQENNSTGVSAVACSTIMDADLELNCWGWLIDFIPHNGCFLDQRLKRQLWTPRYTA